MSDAAVAAAIAAAYPRAGAGADALVQAARKLGADPATIAAVINFESGWRANAVNAASGATGIIQFLPSTARKLGTSTSALKGMSAAQQMPYVEAYLRPYRGRLGTLQAVAMAVFYPKAMNWPEGTAFPASVQKANPGIRTVADYLNRVRARTALTVVERTTTSMAGVWLVGGGLLVTGLALTALRKHSERPAVAAAA